MNKLLMVFVDICLFRAGPQRLPASRFLLGLVLAVHWLLGVALERFRTPLSESMLTALLNSLLPLAVVYALLTLYRRPERLPQAATALLGSEVVLGLPLLLLDAWVKFGGGDPAVSLMLEWMLVAWSIAIAANIFYHSLNVTRLVAAVYAIAYFILSNVLALMAVHGG